jgi:hypothetical protein
VIRQLGKNGVAHRSRPADIKAAEMLEHLSARRHRSVEIRAILTPAAQAEVGLLATLCGGRTRIAVRAAGDPGH